jgi:hypothetical protein
MENISEVRSELCLAFQKLTDGSVDVKTAEALSNMAGKIINTIKIQHEYSALREEKPDIPFMNVKA